ncbi:MAG: cation transporter [Gemmatimonadales bacterium]|nr:cation transporter [Gemmatimonadales bacterium]MYC88252.1 cation transporter [Candidatus Palauibacter denitrificans]
MTSPADRHGRVRRILLWVLLANVAVIAAKLVVGLRSGSIAVLGDAAHSGVDAINNVVGLAAMRLAAAPPDAEHPYGHGKFETLAALAVAAFLSVTCFELIQSAFERLIRGGAPPDLEPAMLIVLLAALVVNGAVALGEARASRTLSSEILAADARHTASDVLVTAGVLAGLALTARTGWAAADAWLALAVALVVARSGYQIFRETIPVLVDERAVDPREIEGVASGVSGVRAVTGVRSRGKSVGRFAELTIRVAPEETVVSAHEIADEVERRVAARIGFTDVTVHVEPHVTGRNRDG